MINDLSTLIQTGDLLISHPLDHTYDLIELKDGDANREAGDILFYHGLTPTSAIMTLRRAID